MPSSTSRQTRSLVLSAAIAGALAIPSVAHANGFVLVTSPNDNASEEGTLRWALEVERASHIRIAEHVTAIQLLNGTLVYDGEAPLTILGSGQRIWTENNETLLAVTEGADLTIASVDFEGPGGFSIEQRGDTDGQEAGKGIFVDVRDTQTGEVRVLLKDVSVSGVANHGIHVSDCSLADACGGGSGGGGDGSPASIVAVLDGVHITNVGLGKFDADGFRVDDRGEGSIYFVARDSSFTHVGADGVELDEGDDGGVFTSIKRSAFNYNGAYCDPDLLTPLLPAEDEGEFADGEQSVADLEAEVLGGLIGQGLDTRCIELEVDTYESGFVAAYEFGIDVDDGIDLDEAGPGSLQASMQQSTILGNFDEGVDFDEEGEGDIRILFVGTGASANTDDGFKFSEEDGGGVFGRMVRALAVDNGGKGMVFEEADDGDLGMVVVDSRTANNDDSDNTGIEAVQEDDGAGTLRVMASDIEDGIDTDGVDQN